MRHAKNVHGIQAATVTIRDPDARRVLEAMASPSNYDAESLRFERGRLTVRREFVESVARSVVAEILASLTATDSLGGDVEIEVP